MLAGGGKVAANATEELSPLHGAEAAGDLLLHLGHADIVLALIVGKRHLGDDHESQDVGLELAQPFQ